MGDCDTNNYLRQVDKSPAPYSYLRATLEYEGKGLETDALQFKHVVMQALTEVFGQIGASDTIDLLKLSSSGDAILRVPSRLTVIPRWDETDTVHILGDPQGVKLGNAQQQQQEWCFVRLLGALTLFGKYKGNVCAFRVQQMSTSLMGLSCNSRTWDVPHLS